LCSNVLEGALIWGRLIYPLALLMTVAVVVSACGRKGPLDPPPGDTGVQPTPSSLNSPPPSGSPLSNMLLPTQAAEPATTPAPGQATGTHYGFDERNHPVAMPGPVLQ
jgi:predicted small lipoprotein YifL